MRPTLALLIVLLPCMAQRLPIVSQARNILKNAAPRDKAEAFLEQALSSQPDDADALTMLALLKLGDFGNNAIALRDQVAPLVQKAMTLRLQNTATPPSDLALALEMQARVLTTLGQETDALPLSAQASSIRSEAVHSMAASDISVLLYKGGPGVAPPMIIQRTDPEYSEAARLAMYSGTVLLSTVIASDGIPRNITLVQNLGFGLDEKAAEALAKWRFQPAIKDGQPVRVRVQIKINFHLH